MWTYIPQNRIFLYKFAQKGYTALSDSYKIWLGEEVPGSHSHAKFYCCGF